MILIRNTQWRRKNSPLKISNAELSKFQFYHLPHPNNTQTSQQISPPKDSHAPQASAERPTDFYFNR
ncbi:MAG TPA: hypothetical protein DEA90_07335 [Opitutae bacterium]|nr:hypothetical protein [Opitutae bacterium]